LAAFVHSESCHLHAIAATRVAGLGVKTQGSPPQGGESEESVAEKAVIASWSGEESDVSKLAQFFPAATAVRIPVRVSRLDGHGEATVEETVIEFGTPSEVLFSARLPLEFGDRIRLVNAEGLLEADAAVVAVQYHQGKTAVAARFTGPVANWVIRK
jgi:hypothetical protein